jgi:hypothetical protein
MPRVSHFDLPEHPSLQTGHSRFESPLLRLAIPRYEADRWLTDLGPSPPFFASSRSASPLRKAEFAEPHRNFVDRRRALTLTVGTAAIAQDLVRGRGLAVRRLAPCERLRLKILRCKEIVVWDLEPDLAITTLGVTDHEYVGSIFIAGS